MRREFHVRFCEGPGEQFPRATRLIVLVATHGDPEETRAVAEAEKASLADELQRKLGLALSEEKTLVTPVTSTMRFLGHHICVRELPDNGGFVPRAVIPKERSKQLRRKIKNLFRRSTCGRTLESQLRLANPILRGWANFYRHAWGAKRVFDASALAGIPIGKIVQRQLERGVDHRRR